MFDYQGSGPVMDQLAASLLPEGFPTKKQSDSKPKVILCLRLYEYTDADPWDGDKSFL